MKRIVVQTAAGAYSIYQTESGVEVYRSSSKRGQSIGDVLIGSLPSPPSTGVECQGGEYFMRGNTHEAKNTVIECAINDPYVIWNYIVLKDSNNDLRILPMTKKVDSSLSTRVLAAEKVGKRSS